MLDYVFFDTALRDRFVKHAHSLGVICQFEEDRMGLLVSVPEDLDDAAEASLEHLYDELQAAQSSLMDQTEGGTQKHVAGFRLDLPDGQSCMVGLDPDIANRLLANFSLEEIQALFATVGRNALNPLDSPLCKH
jgi:hypothetical protein